VCATPNSPFYPLLPIGMQAAAPLRWISGVIGLGHLGTTPLMIVGLLAVGHAEGHPFEQGPAARKGNRDVRQLDHAHANVAA